MLTFIFRVSLLCFVVIVSAFSTVQSPVPKALAADTVVVSTIVRTPAFYQALTDIYIKLIALQALLTQLIAEEASIAVISVPSENGAITNVVVTVDYATKVSVAQVTYKGGASTTVSVSSVEAKAIEMNLAKKLSITTKQLQSVVQYTYIHGDTLVKIIMTLKSSRHISLTKVYADGTTAEQTVSSADIDETVAEDFYGLESVYQAFYDTYLAKVKKGEKPPEMISFVADILNLSPTVVSPLLEFTY